MHLSSSVGFGSSSFVDSGSGILDICPKLLKRKMRPKTSAQLLAF